MEPQIIPSLISGSPEALGFLVFWVLSAAIQGLPVPREGSSLGYRWLYSFAHALVGNVKHSAQSAKKK